MKTYNPEHGRRTCSKCGLFMQEGYVIGGGQEYYCSNECLNATHTKAEIKALDIGADDNDESYWTAWEDSSDIDDDEEDVTLMMEFRDTYEKEWVEFMTERLSQKE